jgi:hypothetical protein
MKRWRPLLSWIYFLCFAAYIVYRWNQLSLDISEYSESLALILLPFTLLLLFIEARKWRILIGQRLAISNALKQVLAGFSTAVFTPGQFGHFVGRKVMHNKVGWTSATGATLLGGFWQTMTFIICGAISLWWIALPESNRMIWIYMRYGSLAAIAIGFTALLLVNPLLQFLGDKNWGRNKFVSPIVKVTAAMRNRGLTVNLKLFGLSLAKSLIIYAQFSWLIYIGGEMSLPWEAVLMIPVVFLILTLLPLPSMLGLIARGEIVLQLWKMYDMNADLAYVCIYALWAFNVLLPAIAGTLLILIYQRRLNI